MIVDRIFENDDDFLEDLNRNELFQIRTHNVFDVDRSFSNNRRSIKFENIKKHLIIEFNFKNKRQINIKLKHY